MKYFLDCEFHEQGPTKPIELISLALVPDSPRSPLYVVNSDYAWSTSSDWLKANVQPHLYAGGPAIMPFANIGATILGYIGAEKPEFWGYYADYDWVVLCQCFGAMIDLPKGWPMFCMDIKQLAVEKGNPRLPEQKDIEHNALADAAWNREAYRFLEAL